MAQNGACGVRGEESRRSHPRFPLLTGGVPFLGFSEDWHHAFLYLPRDVSENGAGIQSSRSPAFQPRAGDRLNLCLPFRFDSTFYDRCELRWVEQSGAGWSGGGLLCHRTALVYPLYLDTVCGVPLLGEPAGQARSSLETLRFLVREALFTKRAIQIYFRHLVPFFSRVSGTDPEREAPVSAAMLGSIERSIAHNVCVIGELLEQTTRADFNLSHRDSFLHRYREAIVSEVSVNLMKHVFPAPIVPAYIRSIRLSEHKLGLNYNTAVLVKHWFV